MSPTQMETWLRELIGPSEWRFDEIAQHLNQSDRALCARTLRKLSRKGVLERRDDRRWTSVEHHNKWMAKVHQENEQHRAAVAAFVDENHFQVLAHLMSRDDFREQLLHLVRNVLARDLAASEVLRFAAFINQNGGA